MTILFFAALVLGAMNGGSFLPPKVLENLQGTIDGFISNLPVEELDSKIELTQAFFSNTQFLILCFVCGISILGFPGLLFLAAYRGYLLGATMSMMIIKYGWTGFAWFFLTIFPQNLLLVPMILLATAWGADFSLSVLLGRWEGKMIFSKAIHFTSCFFLLVALALSAAMIQGYFVPYLVRLFADFLG